MADVISTDDPQTMGFLALAQLIIDGGDITAWDAALADLEANFSFGIPIGLTFASMSDAGPPPQTTTFGDNAAAFQAWVASLS